MSWCPDIDKYNLLVTHRTNTIPGAGMHQDRRYGSHDVFAAFHFSFTRTELSEHLAGAGARKRKRIGDETDEHLQQPLTSAAVL